MRKNEKTPSDNSFIRRPHNCYVTLEIHMAAMIWYHVYFIVVTMFCTRGQWALSPPRALYPALQHRTPFVDWCYCGTSSTQVSCQICSCFTPLLFSVWQETVFNARRTCEQQTHLLKQNFSAFLSLAFSPSVCQECMNLFEKLL